MKSFSNRAIFISGRGSNLQAALDLIDNQSVQLVVSSSIHAKGIFKAKRSGVPCLIFQNWKKLQEDLYQKKIKRIFLLGFMKIIPADFLTHWEENIINLHPSLLPKFPGMHAIEKSFQARVDMGVSIHRVVAEVDAGEILMQKKCVGNEYLSLPYVQNLISITEQRLVREVLRNG